MSNKKKTINEMLMHKFGNTYSNASDINQLKSDFVHIIKDENLTLTDVRRNELIHKMNAQTTYKHGLQFIWNIAMRGQVKF